MECPSARFVVVKEITSQQDQIRLVFNQRQNTQQASRARETEREECEHKGDRARRRGRGGCAQEPKEAHRNHECSVFPSFPPLSLGCSSLLALYFLARNNDSSKAAKESVPLTGSLSIKPRCVSVATITLSVSSSKELAIVSVFLSVYVFVWVCQSSKKIHPTATMNVRHTLKDGCHSKKILPMLCLLLSLNPLEIHCWEEDPLERSRSLWRQYPTRSRNNKVL